MEPNGSLVAMQRGMLTRILGRPSNNMPAIVECGAAPGDRLNVYVRGYAERLRECLAADFPALRGLVGEQVFNLFVRGYLTQCPSHSRSLYDLGAGFAGYLDDTRPADGSDPLDGLPGELARLERARTELIRAPGLEGAAHAAVAPFVLLMPHVRLAAPQTLRLVRSGFALNDVVDAVARGERPGVPTPRATFYAVARINYRVAIHELSAAHFAVLEASAGGADLSSILAAAAGSRAEIRSPDLLAWLPQAMALGLLTTLD